MLTNQGWVENGRRSYFIKNLKERIIAEHGNQTSKLLNARLLVLPTIESGPANKYEMKFQTSFEILFVIEL